MCDPVSAAVVGGGMALGGQVMKGQAMGNAYQRASAANAQAQARQRAYQQRINQQINHHLDGMNIAGALRGNRQAARQSIGQAMAQARPVTDLVGGPSAYRARLASDNQARLGKLANALASMEAWRAYGSREGIDRARLAQRIGTLADFARGQAGVDSLAIKAASVPDQNALFMGQLMTDVGMRAPGIGSELSAAGVL